MVPCVFDDVAGVHCHRRDDLGDVERGAAAEADHAVSPVRLERGDAFFDLRCGRVAVHAGIHAGIEPAVEVLPELGQHRQCSQTAVGHDQRPSQSEVAQVSRRRACAHRRRSEWWLGRKSGGSTSDYRESRMRSQRSSERGVRRGRAAGAAANAMRRNTVKPTEPFISGTDGATSTDNHYRAWRLPGKK